MIFRGEFGGEKPVAFAKFAEVAGFFWPGARGCAMASYISLVNFTEDGARHIRQTTERAKGLVNAAANLGIKIKDIYWTMGAFDAVFIADAPDDETMTAFAMSMASLGNIRTETLRAFSVVEMSRIVTMLSTTEVTTTRKRLDTKK